MYFNSKDVLDTESLKAQLPNSGLNYAPLINQRNVSLAGLKPASTTNLFYPQTPLDFPS
jgi:hypothetical protein